MIGINGHTIAELTKTRSPLTVIFFEDPIDDFFIHVAKVKTKTGKIVDESLIIRPDLQTWIKSYERQKFFIKSVNLQ
jgi:hypothetical protein